MNLLRLFILTFLTLSAFKSEADFKLSDLSIEHLYSVGTNRHWSIPEGERKKGEINLLMKHSSEYFYSKTVIGMMYTDKQFRYGSLEGEIGGQAGRVELFIHHKSEHTLDIERDVKYQNQNSVGIRIQLK